MDKKKLIIIGASASAAIVALVMVVLILLAKHNGVASESLDALANFQGTLTYNGTRTPLELSRVSTSKQGSDNPNKWLILGFKNTSTILTLFWMTKDPKAHIILHSQMAISKPDNQQVNCNLRDLDGRSVANDAHYLCNKRQTFDCVSEKDSQTKIALLQIDSMEFELDGEKESVKRGHYSTEAQIVCL